MEEVHDLVRRARAYAERNNVALSTVSRKLLGNGLRLGELEAGKSLRVDTLIRARETLAQMERAA